MKRSTFFIYLSSLFVLYFFTLLPSFNLALTGDDYLGLWRMNNALTSPDGKWNYINYFFTDYGPQDYFTFLIHSLFGWNHKTYYIFSFICKILAGLSLIPLVFYFTKSKKSVLLSLGFWAIVTTGLETTDWSFNAPSYLALFFMNFFILLYFKSKKSWKLYPLLFIFFFITIVVQPIRTMFLPLAILAFEILVFIKNPKKEVLKRSAIQFVGIIIVTFLILRFTNIGAAAGGTGTDKADTRNAILSLYDYYLNDIVRAINNRDYIIFTNPVAQIGSIIFPTNALPNNLNTISNKRLFVFFILPVIIFILLAQQIIKRIQNLSERTLLNARTYRAAVSKEYRRESFETSSIQKIRSLAIQSIYVFWSLFAFYFYRLGVPVQYSTSQTLAFVFGGYFIITFIIFYLKTKKDNLDNQGIIFATLLLMFCFVIPWLRDPHMFQPTYNRYLIVGAMGLAIMIGLLSSKLPSKSRVLLFLPLFLTHAITSFSYLRSLESNRNIVLTDSIRQSIVFDSRLNEESAPAIYYFETDNVERLHHTIMFGFPMYMHYYHGSKTPWNIGYTTNWKEVVDSFVDGSGLVRFGTTDIEPVKLENIYSFRIEGESLIDTSQKTRSKLSELIPPTIE